LADGEIEKIDRREILSQQFDAAEEEAVHGPSDEFPQSREPDEKPRAPDGKFVSRETNETKPKAAKQENIINAQENVADTPKEPAVWERAPKSWKKEFHEVWGTIDPKGREYIVQRENEMLGRYSELGPKAKLADSISAVAEPYMNTIRGMGIDLPTAVKGLMQADHILRTSSPEQKRAYGIQLLRQYGIDLGSQPVAGQQATPAADPAYYALQNELLQLKGNLTNFQQQQEQAQQAEALNHVNQFASTHEYFEELRPTITKLIETGLETDLEAAYNHALKVNDELSGQIQQSQQAQAEAARRETANRAAKAAKAAAVSVRGSSPSARPASKAQSRREMLLEQFDGVDSRL